MFGRFQGFFVVKNITKTNVLNVIYILMKIFALKFEKKDSFVYQNFFLEISDFLRKIYEHTAICDRRFYDLRHWGKNSTIGNPIYDRIANIFIEKIFFL